MLKIIIIFQVWPLQSIRFSYYLNLDPISWNGTTASNLLTDSSQKRPLVTLQFALLGI